MKLLVNDVWVEPGKTIGKFIQWVDELSTQDDPDVLYFDHIKDCNVLGKKSDFKGLELISRGFVDLGKIYENIDKNTIGFRNRYKILEFANKPHDHLFAKVEFIPFDGTQNCHVENGNISYQLITFIHEQCIEVEEELPICTDDPISEMGYCCE